MAAAAAIMTGALAPIRRCDKSLPLLQDSITLFSHEQTRTSAFEFDHRRGPRLDPPFMAVTHTVLHL